MAKTKLSDVFTNRRTFTVFFLGFASGLPLALTGSGAPFQALLSDAKVDITTIGWFSLVALPYNWKFVWAPILDRFSLPFLGRRRGWIIALQFALIATLIWMGFTSPQLSLPLFACLAIAVAFLSATQDVGIDAYNTEVLHESERGVGSALSSMGYRIAMFASGGGALLLAGYFTRPEADGLGPDGKPLGDWGMVYLCMAGLMLLGVLTTLFGPEPEKQRPPPKTIREAVIDPFKEFFKRKGAIAILLFVIFYKLDFVLATAFSTKFFLELGFSKPEVGAVYKGFGLMATLVGTVGGGALIARLGLYRCLWIFGVLQAVSAAGFMVLASLGKSYPMMVASIAIENVAGGLGTAAFVAFLMSLCDLRYTATQYALLSSAMALMRTIAPVPAGYFVAGFGWHSYFLLSIFMGIPGLILLSKFAPWPGWRDKVL